MEIATSITFEPLLGTEEATIDDKGRLLFSTKKRGRLGERFAIAIGASGCLVAYPKVMWDSLLANMFRVDANNLGRQDYTRLFLGNADDDMKFDGQNRVVIPLKLRELCGLKDKVLIIGCGDRVEIWPKEEFSKFEADQEGYAKARREKMAEAMRKMKEE